MRPGPTRLVLASAIVLLARPLLAQPTIDFRSATWSWADVRAVPGVDSAQVAWLQSSVPAQEARTLLATIAQLSKPEAAQLLTHYYYADWSAQNYRRAAESLYVRPPAGTPGAIRVAYLLARLRRQVLDPVRARGFYPVDFTGRPFALPPRPPGTATTGRAPSIALTFDFAPAETTLAIIGTPDVSVDEAARRVATPPFDALIRHHSQSFYPIPFSRERLALTLSYAASTKPLEALYRYVQPLGLLHFTDVREHRDEYRAMMRTLHDHERDIVGHVAASIAPFLPPGTQLTRAVSFFFADGADGWATGNVAAVDLEYFKDDYVRLVSTIVHETFHAGQQAVRPTRPPRSLATWTAGDSLLARGLGVLLVEGTANYVSPATERTAASADSVAAEGAKIIAELYDATLVHFDRTRAQDLINRGTSGGGPFYWLGAAMSRSIVAADGAAGLARTLEGDGLDFVQAYLRGRRGAADPYLSPELVAAVRRLSP